MKEDKGAGNNKKKSRKKRPQNSRLRTISIDEDDGTQVETKTPIKRRTTRRVKKSNPMDDPEAQKQLRRFCQDAIALGVDGLTKEFMAIKAETSVPPPKAAFDSNKQRNRYQDVFCGDQTRVVLKWPPSNPSDYVHANWVDFKGAKQFICTQGPIDTTVDDFWRIVWQEKCKAVVMLCEIMELGRKKCEAYWPIEQDKAMTTSSGLTIKNLSIIQAEEMITISRLHISSNDESSEPLEVRHVKWNNWPDRGVPKNLIAPFRLLARVQNLEPVLVHCSAGIGRTGTIVGLQMAMQVLGAKEQLSMGAVVRELRACRHGSVQNDVQYAYMHRALIELAEKKNLVKAEEVAKFVEDYEALCVARG